MSSVMNYEENILAAIQTLVNDAIEHASYDKTIQATIKKVEDPAIGKYRISYQDSVFYAYAATTDTTYSVGTSVYVLIPGNDMSRSKTILGTVDNLGADFINILTNEETYENMGVNIANSSGEFELNSYVAEQLIKLYDRTNNINRIGLDVDDAEMYLKQNNYLTLGAYFKTNLPNQQKMKGNYGISFDLVYENELGEDAHQIYTIDIDSFNGSPYDLYSYVKQTSTYENYNKDKFKYIDSISIFENGFPYVRSGEPNDIFVKDIQIFGARQIPEEELASCMLSILTPQGTYFKSGDSDSSVKNLKAQIRVKGKIVNDYSDTRFYWFRENASVTKNTNSDLYCSFGGSGWECLNDSNVTGEDTKEWVPSDENFQVEKSDLLLKENKYKCVALYNNGEVVLSREILLYNLGAAEMSITSSNGQQFYFDMGETVLTCNLSETLPNLSYNWGQVDIYGNFATLEGTAANITVQAKDINRFGIYKCSVYSGENYVGTASITLYNSFDKTENAQIIINNGAQVFKYNTDGIAPNNASLEKPITILPLSFTLFDDEGVEVAQEKIATAVIEWMVPAENTLITIPSEYGIPTVEDGWNIYNNLRTLNFGILTRYDANKENNVIKIRVTLGDKIYTSETNLIFLKEGERGSNGTDFICKVIPNVSGVNYVNQPIVTVYNNNYSLNYSPESQNCWFKVQLWRDGELVYEGVNGPSSYEEKPIKISWSVLKNSYGRLDGPTSPLVQDVSNLAINETTGEVTFDTTKYENAANTVQCKVTYDGVDYYDNIPVIVKFLNTNEYDINLKDNSGFRYAIYESDGRNPKYDNSTPFEIIVKQNETDISLDESMTYTWTIKGNYYEHSQWVPVTNLIPVSSYIETHNLTKNQKRFKPIDSYDGLCVNNNVLCSVFNNSTEIGTIYIPIDLYINRYGNAALNNWNGNSIQIRNEDGLILSPQIGAGRKETNDNTFTGMFMGDVQENATTERETGLFGYYHGQRTIALDAKDGSAKFGRTGAGQIIISPNENENHSIIKSGDYVAPVLDQYGNIITPGQGLEIDLTEPHIIFGSGNFRVDSNGRVAATGYATTSKLESGEYNIPGTENWKLINATDTVQFETNANHYPSKNDTKSIVCQCSYKDVKTNAYTTPQFVDSSGNNPSSTTNIDNISASITKNGTDTTITFNVAQSGQIVNATNTFYVKFTHIASGLTMVKAFYVNLVILGADGQPGQTGPAGPAGQDGHDGKDGTSVTVKGTYNSIQDLCAAHPSGNTLGDGYIIGLDLYIFTNGNNTEGADPDDWNDVGQFKGQDGANGQDAKRCFIVASIEVFKSTDGGSTYTPASSIITPYTQAVTYSSWAYSIDGGINYTTLNPNNLPSGITIDSTTHALTVSNSGAVGTVFENTDTVTFKCFTNDNDVYDVISITKIKDGLNGQDGLPGQDGTPGTDGINTATISLYKRSATILNDRPYTNSVLYTFATHSLDSIPSGWSVSIPSGNDPLYVSSATVSANTATCSIAANDWTLPSTMAQDGINGQDAYTVILSNESHTFAATDTTAIGETITVTPYVYKGSTQQTNYTIGSITGQVTGLTATATTTAPRKVTIKATTNLTTNNGILTIPIQIDGKTFNKQFSWSLAKDGSSPTVYSLIVSHAAVVKKSDGTYNPTAITLTAKSQKGNEAIQNFTTGRYAIFLNGSSTATATPASSAGYSYTIPANTTSIRIALYNSSTGTTILDEQNVSIVYDGIDGDDAIQAVLSNESHTLSANSSGTPSTYSGASTTITVYEGTTDVTSQWTIAKTDPTGVTSILSGNTVTVNGVTNGTGGNITITATKDGTTLTKLFNISVAKAGVNATAYNLITSNTTVTKTQNNTYNPENITFYVTSQTGSSAISTYTSGSYRITKDNGSAGSWTNLSTSNSYSFTTNTPSTGILIEVAKENASSSTHTIIDKQTVAVVTDGIDGKDPYISYLTNESQTFAYGTIRESITQLCAYQGVEERTVLLKSVGTYEISSSTTTTNYYNTGKTGMTFKVSATTLYSAHPTITFKSTASLAQSQTEQIPIVYQIFGETLERTIYFNYSSTKRGDDAISYEAEPSVNTIVKKVDNSFTPESIIFSGYKQIGSNTKTAYSGKWKIQTSEDGSSWSSVYTTPSGTSGEVSTPAYTISGNIKLIKAYLYPTDSDVSTAIALDSQTIPILNDSIDAEYGGRNLLLKSNAPTSAAEAYLIAQYNISDYGRLVEGNQYMLSMNFTASAERKSIRCYIGGGSLGIGDWRIIEGEGTYSEKWLFNATQAMAAGNQIINVYCSNNTTGGSSDPMSGSCKVNWIKLENGNIATDWTPAPEDLESRVSYTEGRMTDLDDIQENVIPTLQNETSNLKERQVLSVRTLYKQVFYQASNYSQVLDGAEYNPNETYYILNNAKYVKTNPHLQVLNIVVTNEQTTDLNEVGKYKIDSNSYYVRNIDTLNPGTPDETWTPNRPESLDNAEIYSCIETTYQGKVDQYGQSLGNIIEYSNPVLEESYQSITDKIYQNSAIMLQGLKDGGNKIYYDTSGFYVYDRSNIAEATKCIYMNSGGINFATRTTTGQYGEAPWKTSSVWTIDGTFDAQEIEVINLTADAISNGVLTLGKLNATDGKMVIQDDAGIITFEANTQRVIYKLNNGGYIIIGRDIGFQICDGNGNIEYGSHLTWTTATGQYQNNVNYYTSQNILTLLKGGTQQQYNDHLVDYVEGSNISGTKYTVICDNIFNLVQPRITGSLNFNDGVELKYLVTYVANTTTIKNQGIAFIKKY